MKTLLVAVLLTLLPAIHVAGQSGRKVTMKDQELTIPDLLLIDQDGKQVRFYSDLLKDKTFALSFFYTDCSYVCTRQGQLFSSLQQRLGSRLGNDVFIVSVTMNPRTDTPNKLRKWAAKYGRQPGWTLLTGRASEVEKLLRLFTGEMAGPKEIHSGVIYLADDRTGRWSQIDDLTPAREVERKLYELKH
ncbi:MAG TPA: SCO family protein [Pyrinomonadaceae bacterium]|nr:SCO family protein [Pyrinomonadaceae bacterium]